MSVINSVQLPADNTQITDQLNTLAGAVADIQTTVDGMGTNTVQVVDGQGEMTASLTEINSKLEGAAVVADAYSAKPLIVIDGVGVSGPNLATNVVPSNYSVELEPGVVFREGEGYVIVAEAAIGGLPVGGEYVVSAEFYSEGVGQTYVKTVVDDVSEIVVPLLNRGVGDVFSVPVVATGGDVVLEFRGSADGAGSDKYHLKNVAVSYIDKSKEILPRNDNRISATVQIDAPCYVEREDGIKVDGGLEWNNRDPLRLISVSGDPVNVRVSEEVKA